MFSVSPLFWSTKSYIFFSLFIDVGVFCIVKSHSPDFSIISELNTFFGETFFSSSFIAILRSAIIIAGVVTSSSYSSVSSCCKYSANFE